TIIAVMPALMQYPSPAIQVWIPLVVPATLVHDRTSHFYEVIGRLKPQASLESAQHEMIVIARRIEQQYSDIQVGRSVRIVPLREQLVGNTRPALLALFGAVAFVLLIA